MCLGYPRLLSGDLSSQKILYRFENEFHKEYFHDITVEKNWENTDTVRRYYLNFPFYPFRTLCPRDLSMLSNQSTKLYEFDSTSPMFPANTQVNLVFNKRKRTNFINSMLPYAIDPTTGTKNEALTAEERNQAASFKVITPKADGTVEVVSFIIKRVDITIKNMYLQVK